MTIFTVYPVLLSGHWPDRYKSALVSMVAIHVCHRNRNARNCPDNTS